MARTAQLIGFHTTARAEGSVSSARPAGPGSNTSAVSKREMLKFALPALGIYLANPLMGNIDNAFVGHFSGTAELAALGPGQVLANNFFFLFAAILNSATTGLVARAWAGGSGDSPAKRVRENLAHTLNVAFVIGVALTAFYAFCSPWALGKLGVPPAILDKASLYARITGLTSWAGLAQGVCLSALLATRDAVTPLKVVASAQVLNLLGDYLLCCWPLRLGIAGAATATALSTLLSFSLMLLSMRKKQFLPRPRLPTWTDAQPVLEYAGPLFIITAARIFGFSAMALAAASLGTPQLAAYQVIISIFIVFVFVSGPLSQSSQSLLPSLIDQGDTKALRKACANIFLIAIVVGVITSALYYVTIRFGAGAFTSDPMVLKEVVGASFSSLLPAATLLVLSTVDGAMTAAKDFKLIVVYQVAAVVTQVLLLRLVWQGGGNYGLPFIFSTLTLRLWICAASVAACLFGGFGRLGGALRPKRTAALR